MTVTGPVRPRRLDVARLDTPIHPLDRIRGDASGPRLWIKRDDQTGSALSGNKIRKLQYTVAEAIDAGADTLLTCGGLQSNHCRTTAALGARMGLQTTLVLRGEEPPVTSANYLLDRLFGASVRFVTPEVYADKANLLPAVADELRAQGRRPFVIAEGCSMPSGSWGYIEAIEEIAATQASLGIEFEHIVCAVGSGGTFAGLELGARLLGLNSKVEGFAVCDDAAHFRRFCTDLCAKTIAQYGLDLSIDAETLRLDDRYVGEGYGLVSSAVLELLAKLARAEGVALDPVYGIKAFYGLLQELDAGRFSDARNILFLHTGGVFGLGPYAAQLPLP